MVALSDGSRPALFRSQSVAYGHDCTLHTTAATCTQFCDRYPINTTQLTGGAVVASSCVKLATLCGEETCVEANTVPLSQEVLLFRSGRLCFDGPHVRFYRSLSTSLVSESGTQSFDVVSVAQVFRRKDSPRNYSLLKTIRHRPFLIAHKSARDSYTENPALYQQPWGRLASPCHRETPGPHSTKYSTCVDSSQQINCAGQTGARDFEMEFQHQDSLDFKPFPTADHRLLRRCSSLGFKPTDTRESMQDMTHEACVPHQGPNFSSLAARGVSTPPQHPQPDIGSLKNKAAECGEHKVRPLKRHPILKGRPPFREGGEENTRANASQSMVSARKAATTNKMEDLAASSTRSCLPARLGAISDSHPVSVSESQTCSDGDEEEEFNSNLVGTSSHSAPVPHSRGGATDSHLDLLSSPGQTNLPTSSVQPCLVAMDTEMCEQTEACFATLDSDVVNGLVKDDVVEADSRPDMSCRCLSCRSACPGPDNSPQSAKTCRSLAAFSGNVPVPSCRRQLSRRRSYQQANSLSTDNPSNPSNLHIATSGSTQHVHSSDCGNPDNDDVFEEEVAEVMTGEGVRSGTPPGSPKAKARRVDSAVDGGVDSDSEYNMWSNDPYQIFQVQQVPCLILTVKVVRGRNITYGWKDILDTPDPYVKLRLRTAPEGRRRTRTIDNTANPLWNETFLFLLDAQKPEDNILEISLMEDNCLTSLMGKETMDQEMGKAEVDVFRLVRVLGVTQTEIFNFSGTAGKCEVDMEMHMDWDQSPTLRYSLCLSDAEKEFIKKRKEKVKAALNQLLGHEYGPRTLKETPTVAVLGSGGGFRAMTGFSGVFKALSDSGLLDCTTFACGLSGSSWYLSTLYSHPRWPDMTPGEMQHELMNNIDKSLMRLLGPQSVLRYINCLVSKRTQGQPVSFTDFFGHMVGETLLKGRLDCRLSEQREKLEDASVPMPLYTCVHVKKDVPAKSFQEWVEFSPFEIGMPKYGTFMDARQFGCKFFMGKLVKEYPEPPLHFLQGIWGSAFCILFKRLLDDNRNMDPVEMVRQEMVRELDEEAKVLHSSDSSEDSEESDNDIDEEEEEGSFDPSTEEESNRGNKADDSLQLTYPDYRKGDKRIQNSASRSPLSSYRGMGQGSSESIEWGERERWSSDREDNCDNAVPKSLLRLPLTDVMDRDEVDSCTTAGRVNGPGTPPYSHCGQPAGSRGRPHPSASVPVNMAVNAADTTSSSPVPITEDVSPGGGLYKRSLSTSPSCLRKAGPSPTEGGVHYHLARSLNAGTRKGVRFSDSVDQREEQKVRREKLDEASTGRGQSPGVSRRPQAGRGHNPRQPSLRKQLSLSRRTKQRSFWNSLLRGLFESQNFELLSTRAGRAAVIHNFMRGLSLQQTYPLSPFTPINSRVQEGDEFDGNFELHPTHIKHIYMVDAGLTFNSPFPLVLRPQREVDVILSFDFSARPSDSTPPFKELLLAEKWARLNRLPFPPIDPTVVDREGMKECYVFQDKDDPHCPVVLHFPLVNIHFRKYRVPGEKRKTSEEKQFADFDIFDDPKTPYSTFNFTYSHDDFRRLSQLTEFNTLHSMEQIKSVLREVVVRKRCSQPRVPANPRQIKLLRMQSVKRKRDMKQYLRKLSDNINNPNSASTLLPSLGSSMERISASSSLSSTPPTASAFFTPGVCDEGSNYPFIFTVDDNSSSSSLPFTAQAGDCKDEEDSMEDSLENPFFNTDRRNSQKRTSLGKTPETIDSTSNPFFTAWRESRGPALDKAEKSIVSDDNGLQKTTVFDDQKGTVSDDNAMQVEGKLSSNLTNKTRSSSSTQDAPRHTCRHQSNGFHDDVFAHQFSTSPDTTDYSPVSAPRSHRVPQIVVRTATVLGAGQQPPSDSDSSLVEDRGQKRGDCVTSQSSSEEEYHDAAEAMTRDGVPVTDPLQAKKYYEACKARRGNLRRQSTISSLNSVCQSISLESPQDEDDEQRPLQSAHSTRSLSSSSGCDVIDVTDLHQFEGISVEHP